MNLSLKLMKNRIQTLYWFIIRPRFYSELFNRISKNFISLNSGKNKDYGGPINNWYEEKAITAPQAFYQLTGNHMNESVREIYKEIFETADALANTCPVKMGGPANIDLLYWLSKHCGAKRIIETGVAYGWSSLAILLSIKDKNNSILISTDMPYPKLNNDKYVGCVIPDNLKTNWKLISLPDKKAIPKAIRMIKNFDMCHYDSDKSYDGRLWCYKYLWNGLRNGGCFISDDISDNYAFIDFSDQLEVLPTIVKSEGKYIGIIFKETGYKN